MAFKILFTEQADEDLTRLEEDRSLSKRLNAVRKALGYLEVNPRHPGLNTHEFTSLSRQLGFKIYEAYKTIHIGDNPHSDCQLVGDRQRINMLWLSPRDQFRFSDQFDKFQRFIGTSIENSLTLGFLVNHCLYNSPFALRDTGFAQINSLKDASQGIFAPLFLRFSQYLSDTCSTGQVLLFLSREGYFLQKLYVKYSEAFQRDTCKNYYFLSSCLFRQILLCL